MSNLCQAPTPWNMPCLHRTSCSPVAHSRVGDYFAVPCVVLVHPVHARGKAGLKGFQAKGSSVAVEGGVCAVGALFTLQKLDAVL